MMVMEIHILKIGSMDDSQLLVRRPTTAEKATSNGGKGDQQRRKTPKKRGLPLFNKPK